jgi:hypothetical protein
MAYGCAASQAVMEGLGMRLGGVARVAALVGLLAFWGGMVMAARRYPGAYDWEYTVVSTLFSVKRNAAGHGWAAAGVLVCGLCSCVWASLMQAPSGGRRGARLVQLGGACMAVAALLPEWLTRGSKLHEMLALAAFASLCLGIVELAYRRLTGARVLARRVSVLLAGAAVSPILLAGAAQLYVFYALPHMTWVSHAWRARQIPVVLSFAFWEWITCVVLTGYVAALAGCAGRPCRQVARPV